MGFRVQDLGSVVGRAFGVCAWRFPGFQGPAETAPLCSRMPKAWTENPTAALERQTASPMHCSPKADALIPEKWK